MIIAIPIIALYSGEGLGLAIVMGGVLSGIVTLWMLAISSLWFAESIIYKILAVFFGGFFIVIFVIVIQFIYEQLVYKKKCVDAN
jgi:hypothetical protein